MRNLASGKVTLYATVRLPTDLGRPSLRHGRLAWHTATRKESKIMVVTLASGARRTMAATRIGLLGNPSVYRTKVVWVDARFGVTFLKQGWLTSSQARRPGEAQEPHGELLDDERREQRGLHDALGHAHRADRRLSPHAVNSP